MHRCYVALADRFAEAGHPAVAVDCFARTPGGIDADSAAAVDLLRERTGPHRPVVAVGFCSGGSQAGGTLPLVATVGWYGEPPVAGDAAVRRPVLMLIAGDDAATPVADRAAAQGAEASTDAWRRVLALLDQVA